MGAPPAVLPQIRPPAQVQVFDYGPEGGLGLTPQAEQTLIGFSAAGIGLRLLLNNPLAVAGIGAILAGATPFGFGVAALLLAEETIRWRAQNARGDSEILADSIGRTFTVAPGQNVTFSLQWEIRNWSTDAISCPNPPFSPGGVNLGNSTGPWSAQSVTVVGSGFRIDRTRTVNEARCSPGTNTGASLVSMLSSIRADGQVESVFSQSNGGVTYNPSAANEFGVEIRNVRGVYQGQTTTAEEVIQNPLPEAVQPREITDPAALPDSTRYGGIQASGVTPRFGELPAAAGQQVASPTATATTGASAPALPAAGAGVTASAPSQGNRIIATGGTLAGSPTLAPPIPTTPPTVREYPGITVGAPAASPPATLSGIAAEVGRLEQKVGGLLGGLGIPPQLSDLIYAALGRLLEDLFNDVPGDSYSLIPPCPPSSGEDPPEAMTVSWDTSTNGMADLRRRMDALAVLIQFHKDQGQPSCTTPVAGEEVTVIFEADP